MIDSVITTDDNQVIATAYRASQYKAEMVIRQTLNDDGRSPWYWFVLANGDVIMGCFPLGKTFESISQSGELQD